MTAVADAWSSDAVGSSSRTSGASDTAARASAIRRRCPPDSRAAPSPTACRSRRAGRARTRRPARHGPAASTPCRVALGRSVRDVLGDGRVEQPRILRNERDAAAQAGLGDVAQVDPVDQDRPGVDVVEPQQQVQDRALAGAARAEQAHRLAGMQGQVEAVEHRPVGVIAEADRVEAHAAAERRGQARADAVGHALGAVSTSCTRAALAVDLASTPDSRLRPRTGEYSAPR